MYVDPSCPLDGSHPINQGKVFHAYGPMNSGWTGGATVRDLIRGLRTPYDGTRTNGPSWAWTPYGIGLSYIAGSSQYVDHGAIPAVNGATTWTLAAWVKRASSLVAAVTHSGSGRREGFTHYSDNNIYFLLAAGTTYGVVSYTNTDWYRIHMVYNGALAGNAKLLGYANGKQLSLGYVGVLPTTLGTAGTFQVGRDVGIGTSTCTLADVAQWNRALSPSDVMAEYKESRAGYPDAFNWLRAYPSEPVAASPPPPPGVIPDNPAPRLLAMGLI